MFTILIVLFTLYAGPGNAQEDNLESVPVHKNEKGLSFSLATSGLGLGVLYRKALPSFFYVGVNLEFFMLRDDHELEIFDPVFGQFVKINDENNLFIIPLNLEVKKRLFANDIENNFRPHVLAQVGAVFGMNFPNDIVTFTGQRIDKDNEFRLTYDALIGLGVDFTTRKDYYATIRTQYRYAYFPKSIAGKKDHSAFEIRFEVGVVR
ncbi:MAG: hypothetical protein D6681_05210 [Calditrichaeota bacterium]|nr:MAG: hypothetical protein D6681_05210 [Calditrichota bacterium]